MAFSHLQEAHLDFRTLRPLHVGGALGWIYLASLAVVLDFLLRRYGQRLETSDAPLNLTSLKRIITLIITLWLGAAAIAFSTEPM